MNWKQAWDITQGGLHPAQASAIKVFASEFNVEGYHLLMEVLGEEGTIRDGSPGAVLRGRIERDPHGGQPPGESRLDRHALFSSA